MYGVREPNGGDGGGGLWRGEILMTRRTSEFVLTLFKHRGVNNDGRAERTRDVTCESSLAGETRQKLVWRSVRNRTRRVASGGVGQQLR